MCLIQDRPGTTPYPFNSMTKGEFIDLLLLRMGSGPFFEMYNKWIRNNTTKHQQAFIKLRNEPLTLAWIARHRQDILAGAKRITNAAISADLKYDSEANRVAEVSAMEPVNILDELVRTFCDEHNDTDQYFPALTPLEKGLSCRREKKCTGRKNLVFKSRRELPLCDPTSLVMLVGTRTYSATQDHLRTVLTELGFHVTGQTTIQANIDRGPILVHLRQCKAHWIVLRISQSNCSHAMQQVRLALREEPSFKCCQVDIKGINHHCFERVTSP